MPGKLICSRRVPAARRGFRAGRRDAQGSRLSSRIPISLLCTVSRPHRPLRRTDEKAMSYNVKSSSSKCQVYVKFSLANVKFFQRFLWRFRGISKGYDQCQGLFLFCQVFFFQFARRELEACPFHENSGIEGTASSPNFSKFFQIFWPQMQVFPSFSKPFSFVVL